MWSWIGGGVVVASTLWVALQKVPEVEGEEKGQGRNADEEEAFILGNDEQESDIDENENGKIDDSLELKTIKK